MSLEVDDHLLRSFRFPRVSGDEPASNGGDLYPEAFSPRERG